MAGMFDDLIPAQPASALPPATGGGMFDDLIPSIGRGDFQGLAPGAVQHAMPADTVQGGPPPSIAGDIANSAGSRAVAGALDLPGTGGDLVGLANSAADLIASPIAKGIRWLEGKPQMTPEEQAAAQAQVDARGSPLGFLPNSQDVKKAVGFTAYQPQTGVGQTFDKYVGSGIELAPSVLAGGVGGGIKKVAGDVIKYAAAPAAASEVAGDATKGTALEPWARLGAAVATGGIAGAKGAKITGALTTDQWHAVADQAYKDVKAAGVAVNPKSFDSMVSGAEQDLHAAGYRPALHSPVKIVLDEMKAAKGVPQSYQELDQMHRLAMGQTKSLDADTRRVAGMLADKIDTYMEGLKPGDLISAANPGSAFNSLIKARDAWRRMRTGEMIDNMVAKAKDAAGANYTAAGLQTALKQQFRGFKWTGKAQLTPAFKRLSDEEKTLVNGIIGGGNALRMIGKINFRNPVVSMMAGALGMSGGATLPAAILGAGEAARHISAKGTLAKVDQLNAVVRGGKVTPGRRGLPPNAIFLGTAAQRAADQSKNGGQ